MTRVAHSSLAILLLLLTSTIGCQAQQQEGQQQSYHQNVASSQEQMPDRDHRQLINFWNLLFMRTCHVLLSIENSSRFVLHGFTQRRIVIVRL